jgi:hypothetical protein
MNNYDNYILIECKGIHLCKIYDKQFNNPLTEFGDSGNLLNDSFPSSLRHILQGDNLFHHYINFKTICF